MNYADIKTIDIQDGTGVRVSIYVSGCHFHCKGCHNKVAWDFNYGKKFTDETIEYILNAMNKSYISGLSILGGEPLEIVNQKSLVKLVSKVKKRYPEKNIWLYTGYDFQEDILNKMYKEYDFTKELINNIDIIVDGEFVEDKKIIDLKFRGSTNQRKIDVQESLKIGKIVELKFGDEDRYEIKKNNKILLFKSLNSDQDTYNQINNREIEVYNEEKDNELNKNIEIKPFKIKEAANNFDDNINKKVHNL